VGRELLVLDLGSRSVRQRITLMTPAGQPVYDGVKLWAEPLAVTPDGARLLLANSFRNDTVGLALFDPAALRVRAFRPFPDVLGFGFVPSGGALAAIVQTSREPGQLISTSLVLLDIASLATIDSIALPRPFDNPIQVVSGPNPDLLFIGSWSRFFAYSRVERQVVASVIRPAIGDLAISPDGQLLAAGDMGTWPDDPGTGKVFFYSKDLIPLQDVDLPKSPNGQPLTTTRLAFSLDGRRLLVSAGTPSTGPLFGPQPAQVLVIDTGTLQFVRAIPLGDWGAPIPFPLR